MACLFLLVTATQWYVYKLRKDQGNSDTEQPPDEKAEATAAASEAKQLQAGSGSNTNDDTFEDEGNHAQEEIPVLDVKQSHTYSKLPRQALPKDLPQSAQVQPIGVAETVQSEASRGHGVGTD